MGEGEIQETQVSKVDQEGPDAVDRSGLASPPGRLNEAEGRPQLQHACRQRVRISKRSHAVEVRLDSSRSPVRSLFT